MTRSPTEPGSQGQQEQPNQDPIRVITLRWNGPDNFSTIRVGDHTKVIIRTDYNNPSKLITTLGNNSSVEFEPLTEE